MKGDFALRAQTTLESLAERIPNDALRFGAAGLLPYAGTSLTAGYLARQAGIAAREGNPTPVRIRV